MIGQRGFTLIEVLAALAVLALTLGAILSATAHYGRNAVYLQERMVAGWIAHNQLVESSLEPEWPAIGRKNGRIEMSSRTWYWEREVQTTPDDEVRRITVRVRNDTEQEAWLSILKAFFAKPDTVVAAPPG